MELKVKQQQVERVLVAYPLSMEGKQAALDWCETRGYRVKRSGPMGTGTGTVSRSEGLVIAERERTELEELEPIAPYPAVDEEE